MFCFHAGESWVGIKTKALTTRSVAPPASYRHPLALTGAGISLKPVTDRVLSSLIQAGVLQAALVKESWCHLAVTARKGPSLVHYQPTQPHRLGLHEHVEPVPDVEPYPRGDSVLLVAVVVVHRERGGVHHALLSEAAAWARVSAAHLAEGVPFCPGHAPVSGAEGGWGQGHALAEAAGSVVKISG